MATPSDLVAHYSSKAFATRIYALTFVGATIAATLVWLDYPARSNALGVALLAVVASLAELNRRFTYSYLCACLAASRTEDEAMQWGAFKKMNEGPWSDRDDVKPEPAPNPESRFFLMWATYLPGVLAALCLQVPPGVSGQLRVPVSIACVGVLSWWWHNASYRIDPEKYLKERPGDQAGEASKAKGAKPPIK